MLRNMAVFCLVFLVILSAVHVYSMPDMVFVVSSYSWTRLSGRAGGVNVLELILTYYGDKIILSVRVHLKLMNDSWSYTATPCFEGSWEPGFSKKFSFTVNASEIPNDIKALVKVTYDSVAEKVGGKYEVSSEAGEYTFSFDLKYSGLPLPSIYVKPNTLIDGMVNNISLMIFNNGSGNIIDPQVTVYVSGATIIDRPTPLRLSYSKIEAGSYVIEKMEVLPSQKQVTFTVNINYLDGEGNVRNEQYTITLPVIESTTVLVLAEPNKLFSGSIKRIKVRVINLGDIPLLNTLLKLYTSQGSGIVVSPQLIELGDIGPQDSVECEVEVSVPLTVISTQNILYDLIYRSVKGVRLVIHGSLNVFVVEKARLIVSSIDYVPEKPSVNSTLVLSISLINTGNLALNSINVTVEQSSGLIPLRKTYYFIGQLNPQSPVSVPFSFRAVEVGEQTIKIIIFYKDIYGASWNITREVSINVSGKSAGSNSSTSPVGGALSITDELIVLAILVAIVGLVAVMWFLGKRRRQ